MVDAQTRLSLYFKSIVGDKSRARNKAVAETVPHIILVLDEIDRFCENKSSQNVVYNLLEWSKVCYYSSIIMYRTLPSLSSAYPTR